MLPISCCWPAARAPINVADCRTELFGMPASLARAASSLKSSGQGSLQAATLSVPASMRTPARYAWPVMAPPTASSQLFGGKGGSVVELPCPGCRPKSSRLELSLADSYLQRARKERGFGRPGRARAQPGRVVPTREEHARQAHAPEGRRAIWHPPPRQSPATAWRDRAWRVPRPEDAAGALLL